MDNEKLNGQPGSPEDAEARAWLEQLLASTDGAEDIVVEKAADAESSDRFAQMKQPAQEVKEIGADEHAVAAHGMKGIADIELDKIIQEADEWDLDALQREIMAAPIEAAFDDDPPADDGDDDEADDDDAIYADGGNDPDEVDTSRKVRPKRKNGYGLFGLPHMASVVIWVTLCVTIGISLGRMVWICAAEILAFGRPNQSVEITITDEDDVDSVAQKLKDLGLIKYPGLFKVYAQIADVTVGNGGKISTGKFTLNKQYDYHALVGGMTSGSAFRQTIMVTIPEGYTCAQIFSLLEDKGVCSVAALEQYCIEHEFESYWFLENVEKGTAHCLEGYLFPDTYEFYVGSSARQVFIKLLAGFDNRISDDMLEQLEMLNETVASMYRKRGFSQSYIDEHQLTMKEVIIVASMIEKESAYTGESQNIASVIYNRLTNPNNFPHLQIDATVVYALGGKTDLTLDDLRVDSPYNTYVCEGLPAGPISNPGLYSIKAALNPHNTNYYFYALDTSGESKIHAFFKTQAEFDAFLKS